MADRGPIEHRGRVVDVDSAGVDVEMTVESACVSCRARIVCGMGEQAHKRIRIETPSADAYRVGDEVIVSVAARTGAGAVVVAYAAPAVLLVAALVAALGAGLPEWAAALATIGCVALYFLGLTALRGRLKSKIQFQIRKS